MKRLSKLSRKILTIVFTVFMVTSFVSSAFAGDAGTGATQTSTFTPPTTVASLQDKVNNDLIPYQQKKVVLPVVQRLQDGSLVVYTEASASASNSSFEYKVKLNLTEIQNGTSYDRLTMPLDSSEQVTSGRLYELFQQAKLDTASYIYNLTGLNVSTKLSDLTLYSLPDGSTNEGEYGGGTEIFIQPESYWEQMSSGNMPEGDTVTTMSMDTAPTPKPVDTTNIDTNLVKTVLMHEMIHYLIRRANNGSEGSFFANSDGYLTNRFDEEGLAVLLSEAFYGTDGTSGYYQQPIVAKILFSLYGKDFLLDAFAGRESVVRKDMTGVLGKDYYDAFVIASYDYTLLSTSQPSGSTEQNILLNVSLNILQEFINKKGDNWNVLNLQN